MADAMDYLIGQVMKKSDYRADPKVVRQILEKEIHDTH